MNLASAKMSNEFEQENSFSVENKDKLSFERSEGLLLDIVKEAEAHRESKLSWRRVLSTFDLVQNVQSSPDIDRLKRNGTEKRRRRTLKLSCGIQENCENTAFMEYVGKKEYESCEVLGINPNLSFNDNMNEIVSKRIFVEQYRTPDLQKENEAWRNALHTFDSVKNIPHYTSDNIKRLMYVSNRKIGIRLLRRKEWQRSGKHDTDWSINQSEQICKNYENVLKISNITESENDLSLNKVSVKTTPTLLHIPKSLTSGISETEVKNNNSPQRSDIENIDADCICPIRSGPDWELDLFIKTIENDLRQKRKSKPIKPKKGGYLEKFKDVTRKISSDVKLMNYQERIGIEKGLRGVIVDRDVSYGVNAAKVQFENGDICIVFLDDYYRTVKAGRVLMSSFDNSNYYMADKLRAYLQINRIVLSD